MQCSEPLGSGRISPNPVAQLQQIGNQHSHEQSQQARKPGYQAAVGSRSALGLRGALQHLYNRDVLPLVDLRRLKLLRQQLREALQELDILEAAQVFEASRRSCVGLGFAIAPFELAELSLHARDLVPQSRYVRMLLRRENLNCA